MPLLPLEGPETTTHVFSLEMPLCDFCVLVPGAVDVECESGDCEPESTASILFASGCCLGPYCDCECYGGADTPDTYTLNMTVFPACVASFDSPITLELSLSGTYFDGYAIDENDNDVVIRLTCEHGYFTPENTSPPSTVPCDNQPACRYLLSFSVTRLTWSEELEAYVESVCEWHGYLCDPGSFPWVFSGTTNRETQCVGCDDDWEAEVTE